MRSALTRPIFSAATLLLCLVCGTSQIQAAKVAVIDSGSNQAGVTGIDFVRGDNIPNDETSNQHGTTITRVISGYKPPSDIIALKVVGSTFNYNTTTSEAALSAAVSMDDVKVIDMSHSTPVSLGSLQDAANGDRVLVINAGNRAGARPIGIAEFAPVLDGKAIIVGALDRSGNLAVYSNRAGDLAEYYVVAPGFNNFSSTQGTSFAKPHVSGLAALLLWTFPNLSARDAVQIILETATDLGAPGVDPVYGHGQINVQKALDPAEGEMIAPGGDDGGGGGGSAAVVIGVVAAVGVGAAVLTKKDDDQMDTTLVLDKYGRAYTMDLSDMAQVRDSRSSLDSILKSLNVLEKTHVVSQDDKQSAFLRITEPTLENSTSYNPTSWLNDDPAFRPEPTMAYYQNSYDGSGHSFHVNSSLDYEFGALGLASTPEDQISFLSNKSFSSPFLGYASNGVSSQLTHALTPNSTVSFGMSRIDEETQYGLRSDAAVFEVTHRQQNFALSASVGQLTEFGSLFGGSSNSPYSADDATTMSFGLSGSYKFAENARIIGNYARGYTEVNSSANTFLSDFSSLQSDTWALGLMFDNVVLGRDRIGFAVSRPLKIIQGEVDLTVPYAMDLNGNVSRSSERIDLGSGARELALESFYRVWSGKSARFTTYLMHQRNPSNLSDAGSANTILGVYEYQF